MINGNRKGFVITEMLMVAVFIVTIFTFIYTSTIPLIGKYRDIAERENNIDIIYKLYNIRNLIRKDDNFSKIDSDNVKRLNCSDLVNVSACTNLMDYLGLHNYDLFYINNISANLNNVLFNNEVNEYLNKYSTDDQKTLLLLDKDNHTIAHLAYEHENVMNSLPNSITNLKTSISKIIFQKENKTVMDDRYNAASIKADITYNNQGRVLAWLERDTSNSSRYILYIESNGTTYLNTGNQLFKDYTNVREIIFNNVDTTKVTNMSEMFSGCRSLVNLHIGLFNTSNVTTMYGMFRNCSLMSMFDLKKLNTAKVQNMAYMFNGCTSLHLLDLSNFDTSNVTTMESMFNSCLNIVDIYLSKFDTGKVTNMNSMFNGCTNLIELNLNTFNTSKVTNMNSMFNGCTSLVNIYVSDLWTTTSVTNSGNMFNNVINIYGGNGTKYNSSFIDKTYARIDSQNMQIGYLKYKSNDDNYIQILNLVKNGSFENNYTNWTTMVLSGTNPVIINTSYKKYRNKSSSRIASSGTSNYLTQDVLFIENHKYYYFMHGYTTSTANQAIISDVSNRSGSAFTINVKSNLGWVKGSVIYNGIYTETRSISVNYGVTSGVTFIDGIGIIDLTETFGKGSEPTKAWCDANIDYYNDIVRYHV